LKKPSFTESSIDAAESDYLYVATSQLEKAGMGLFTAIDIHRDEVITFFKGKILTQKQIDIRVKKKTDQYFINLLDGSVMDSKDTQCFAKYANDAEGKSQSKFRNNAMITLNEEDNVCLVALRKIKVGDEVFCGYGKKYWLRHK
jgi:uncharacterized protein